MDDSLFDRLSRAIRKSPTPFMVTDQGRITAGYVEKRPNEKAREVPLAQFDNADEALAFLRRVGEIMPVISVLRELEKFQKGEIDGDCYSIRSLRLIAEEQLPKEFTPS